MASPDDGIITITLDGAEYDLRPTLAAAKGVSRQFGGFTQAVQRMQAMDIEAMAQVIRYGIKADDAMQKKLPELVYSARPLKLIGPLVTFVMILANGGQPLRDETDEGNGAAADAA